MFVGFIPLRQSKLSTKCKVKSKAIVVYFTAEKYLSVKKYLVL